MRATAGTVVAILAGGCGVALPTQPGWVEESPGSRVVAAHVQTPMEEMSEAEPRVAGGGDTIASAPTGPSTNSVKKPGQQRGRKPKK